MKTLATEFGGLSSGANIFALVQNAPYTERCHQDRRCSVRCFSRADDTGAVLVSQVPEGHTAHCAVLRFFALKPGLEPSLLSKGEEQGGLSPSDSPGWSPLM